MDEALELENADLPYGRWFRVSPCVSCFAWGLWSGNLEGHMVEGEHLNKLTQLEMRFHRIVQVGIFSWGHIVYPPAKDNQQIAQNHVQFVLEYVHRWGLHSLLGSLFAHAHILCSNKLSCFSFLPLPLVLSVSMPERNSATFSSSLMLGFYIYC